ncbi:hypothetical protein ACFX2I_025075 [Malus domestica]|uniref:uncharacterized protein n=1 Tax=Malus domestica TaxID=3750 RepID=UPI003976CF84
MPLRSSSTPILNSWMSHCKDSSPEPEPLLCRNRSVSLSLCTFHPPTADTTKTQVSLESDIKIQQKPRNKKLNVPIPRSLRKKSKTKAEKPEEPEEEIKPTSRLWFGAERLFSSSGLGEKIMDGEDYGGGKKKESVLQTLVVGGGVGNSGGKICGGGGGGKGSDGGEGSGFGFFEGNNRGSGSTDAYYQKMIEADPGNALLLGNYAKFLKEVRGDYEKAEEYCGRSILANPSDANTLSLYGDLIWNAHRDAERAENYFDQAVKTSPDDCYVLASYAHFLWDAEDDEDDEENQGVQRETDRSHTSSSNFFHGSPHHSPLTAAS